MGLERKPGFGLYGPPNKPATHRSLLGKLTPIIGAKNTNAHLGKKGGGVIDRMSRFLGIKKRKELNVYPRHYIHPSAKTSVVAERIRESFTEEGVLDNITETLTALTQEYGRETPPSIVPMDRGMVIAADALGGAVYGLYNSNDDTIEINEKYMNLTERPISRWNHTDVFHFRVYMHETLHSTSPRLRAGGFYNNAIAVAIEEGLTEYLTHNITTDLLQDPYRNTQYLYEEYVNATTLMAHYGGLEIDAAFRDGTKDHRGEWNIRHTIEAAQDLAVRTIMTGAGYTEQEIRSVFTKLRLHWYLDVLTMALPEFQSELQKMVNGEAIDIGELIALLNKAVPSG